MKRWLFLIIVLLFLGGCQNYTVDVKLTPEEQANYEQQVADYTQKIKTYDPRKDPLKVNPDGDPLGPADSLPEGIELGASEEIDPRPPFAYFLNLALAQERLGRLGDAIKTYKKALKQYEISEVAWNNLAHIYEQVGDYDKTVEYYQKIIDQFGLMSYYLDMANTYIKKGDPRAAQKVYDQYRLSTNLTDITIERAIQKLKKQSSL